MSKQQYTEDELKRYFSDPSARHTRAGDGYGAPPDERPRPQKGLRGYFHRRFENRQVAQAAFVLSFLLGFLVVFTLALGLFALTLTDELPTFQQLDNPNLQLATVAYTPDREEQARYAYQNRSWVPYEDISPHVVNALIAIEDRRFYDHWGVDMRGLAAAAFDALTRFDVRGASTITQQLARNLYNEQIGRQVTVERKLKEMVTAVQLERRYTKREIVEMYLNTVEYVYNAFGIEAAARTFFGKPAGELNELEAATLVGMLQNPVYYNPVRRPERTQARRNTVLLSMVETGYLPRAFYDEHRDAPVELSFNRSEITASLAPYFAEYVRLWMRDWARANGYDLYADGLVVYTTLDSRLQEAARAAVDEQMKGLQAVVDYEWSRPSGYVLGTSVDPYLQAKGFTPFQHFWESKRELVDSFIRETPTYRALQEEGRGAAQALAALRADTAFMDSLKAAKTRLEAGLVALDPKTGYVKAWVGGRDLEVERYDHVAVARRQPGSTFKPFVYTAAIDNGYPPTYRLPDSAFVWRNPETGQVWRPSNFEGVGSGGMLTLEEALALSKNTVTARVITQLVNPSQVAFYARAMGIESPLDPVPALALGTSDVTLLELTSGYGTLASGGLHYDPTVVTRIEDRYGNVLYEATPAPEEALSEETAYTVVDMMRGAVEYGTSVRIRTSYGLGAYDLAAKTGTTQNAADGWFMMMHPELVTGAWVGFNDRRITFRSTFWGQGAHNALFLVGDFFRRATRMPDSEIDNVRFPSPAAFSYEPVPAAPSAPAPTDDDNDRRVGW